MFVVFHTHAASFVMAFVASYALTGLALMFLLWANLFDNPNERSSHHYPTPRGGGLAVLPVILGAWVLIGYFFAGATQEVFGIAALALVLGAVSWLDDVRNVPVLARLLVQIVVVLGALYVMRDRGPYFGGWLSPDLDILVAGLLWVWFVNLYNFMDGIDGITGVETASIGLGVMAVGFAAGLGDGITMYAGTIAAAALGFLWWNWQPARLFLGDVGSVPLGFLTGWLLLMLMAKGQWAAAAILPLYYLADSTVTLLRRILKGEKFWRPHRSHFYQRATEWRLNHRQASIAVAVAGLLLIVLAVVASKGPILPALGGAAVVVAGLLFHFGRRAS